MILKRAVNWNVNWRNTSNRHGLPAFLLGLSLDWPLGVLKLRASLNRQIAKNSFLKPESFSPFYPIRNKETKFWNRSRRISNRRRYNFIKRLHDLSNQQISFRYDSVEPKGAWPLQSSAGTSPFIQVSRNANPYCAFWCGNLSFDFRLDKSISVWFIRFAEMQSTAANILTNLASALFLRSQNAEFKWQFFALLLCKDWKMWNRSKGGNGFYELSSEQTGVKFVLFQAKEPEYKTPTSKIEKDWEKIIRVTGKPQGKSLI